MHADIYETINMMPSVNDVGKVSTFWLSVQPILLKDNVSGRLMRIKLVEKLITDSTYKLESEFMDKLLSSSITRSSPSAGL